jgi:WD40 repeat protein
MGLAVSPDGRSVYVTNSADGTISQYDVGAGGGLTPKSPRIVSAGGNPVGVALGPDGASAYTTDGSHGDVLQYDVSEAGALSPNSRGSVLAGMGPVGVALRPDQGPVASFSMTPASVGSATGFDGSASSDSDGSVARYDWSFGDGVSAADAGPRPTHTYGAAGLYSVRLTVTDDSRCSTAQVFTGQTAYCDGGPAAIATRTLVVPVSTAGPTPYLSSLSLRPSSLRAAPSGPSVAATRTRTGSTLAYADSQAATTFFLVKRGKAGIRRGTACVPRPAGRRGGRLCTRLITLGGFTHHDRAGANRLHFTGRLRGRKLAPGVYELTATPSAAGRVGGTLARLFRILR